MLYLDLDASLESRKDKRRSQALADNGQVWSDHFIQGSGGSRKISGNVLNKDVYLRGFADDVGSVVVVDDPHYVYMQWVLNRISSW